MKAGISILGQKCGMTRVFTEDGSAIPVTVIRIDGSNKVSQIKRLAHDGYSALQIASGTKRNNLVNKPLMGHFKKAGIEAPRVLRECRVSEEDLQDISLGDSFGVDIFKVGQYVDVAGITKGKGFAGAVRRHGFRTQDASHGNSLSHRAPGSIGQCQTPGRVFKGKKMAGHMGNARRIIQNLEIISVDPQRNIILIKGAVPGARSSNVIIGLSVKKKQTMQNPKSAAASEDNCS